MAEEAQRRVEELEQGACRFNCRTQKAMFILGFNACLDDMYGDAPREITAEDAYDEFRRKTTQSDNG